MSDFSLFLGKFLRHGTAIASLAPSSPWLSRTTVRNIDWDRAKVARRAGRGHRPDHPGPGREGAARLPGHRPGARPRLRPAPPRAVQRLPNFDVVEGDVRDLAEILAERGIDQVDYVISGLPVPSFPKDLQRDLFRVVKQVLAPEGTYNQITEMPWVYCGSTASSSTTSSSPSSRGTSPPPAPTSAGASRTSLNVGTASLPRRRGVRDEGPGRRHSCLAS